MTVELLKPCPFCGCDPHMDFSFPNGVRAEECLIQCGNDECGCEMVLLGAGYASALKQWNTRKTKPIEKRTYTKAQIKAMDIKEYAECIDDIRLALDDGRILNDEGAVLS